MLKQRVLTATVLSTLFVLAALYLPHSWLVTLLGVIVILAAIEWVSLAQFESNVGIAWIVVVGIMLTLTWWYWEYLSFHWLILGIAWWCVAGYKIIVTSNQTETQWVRGLSGVLVLIPTWVALSMLHQEDIFLFLALFVLVWSADTGAYFCGRAWGQRKLAPVISPGKTVEGFIGGMALVLLFALCVVWWKQLDFIEGILWALLCVITIVFSTLGDLWESKLKRLAGMKDSGSSLPGHGGILDRIDSITAAAPVFACGLMLWR